uniref:Uncharacterized sensor-like histidine kinase ycf26 n=1 Tax=Leiomenia cribrosa TaxID=217483 RepID=A0A4D6WV94_9FLOR|nr:Drug sensory protein A [Leiomenia cribrosa]
MINIIFFKNFIRIISAWWLHINLSIRLMALTTLTVSLVMSSVTFWSLATIQQASIIADIRFCQDLGVLFSTNMLDLIEANNQKDLASFIEKIYLSTSSVRYILFLNVDGKLSFGLPVYTDKVQSLLQLNLNLFHLETRDFLFGIPLVKYNTIFDDNIIDIVIPLIKNGKNLGSLDIGINSNITFSSSKLIRDITISIFVSIWLMFIIGAAFNALTITEPIKELLLGVKSIASGNFSQRIMLPFDGELGDLIFNFNEMAEKLESYEKQNIDKLMFEKRKLEKIVGSIDDGAILIDTELRFLFVNDIAIKAFNWSNLDLIGQSIFHFFPKHVNEALFPVLNSLVESSYLYNLTYKTEELSINFDYNSKKIFRFILTTVFDFNISSLTGITIISQDISRETKLINAKNHFIANVSHELRTPLCNIGSFLETLLDYHDNLSDNQKIHFLNVANNETKRLSALVNDILDLSQLESEYNYTLVKVHILDIIDNIVQASSLMASYNNIYLKVEFDPRIIDIWAHESSLFQVFANLISNAIKFTNVQGQIVIRVYLVNFNNYHKERYSNYLEHKKIEVVRLEIIDEGIGLDIRDQKHVFDRFVRIENNIHLLEGTGLGLSIVKNILNKYNTDIILYSELLVGTSLWFDLLKAS